MFASKKIWALCESAAVITALLLFLKGFLPVKTPLQGYATVKLCDRGILPCQRVYDRVVLMIVDALKSDFVFDSMYCHSWPHLCESMRHRKVQRFKAKTHPPTVTLPRIKALTSGEIPGFIDVILNFASEELVTDNLIYQLQTAGDSIVFYGDDTWLKLFPHSFLRKEGTTSFFVSDYTEVDFNVTRALMTELEKSDWNMMILHYLGLDHIGHLSGPNSPLVHPKLLEMDNVLQQIIEKVDDQDKMSNTSTLVLLTGDHGMADQGGHGGVTSNEINTPLVFIGKQMMSEGNSNIEEVYQIDLVPTLAALLNVPIPLNNLGVGLQTILSSVLGQELTLEALSLNAQQVSKLLEKNRPDLLDGQVFYRYSRVQENHAQWKLRKDEVKGNRLIHNYTSVLIDMRENIASSLVEYDVVAMKIGAIVITLVLVTLLNSLIYPSDVESEVSLLSWAVSSLAVITTGAFYCTSVKPSIYLCSSPLGYVNMVWIIPLLAKTISSTVNRFNTSSRSLRKKTKVHNLLPDFALPSFTALHSISLLSSSYIEEEHQLAYFYVSTFLCILLLKAWCNSSCYKFNDVMKLLAAMLLCNVLRRWNQTGDKWKHLPDIADYLTRPENYLLLLLLIIISYTVAMTLILRGQTKTIICLGVIASLANLAYTMGEIGYITTLSYRGHMEAFIVYTISAFLLINAAIVVYTKGDNSTASLCAKLSWVLFAFLLHRPSNIPVMAMVIASEALLSSHLTQCDDTISVSFIYFWLGQAFFFYQGNSNTLNTIDVGAGYKGLLSYNPTVSAFLLLCNTYAGPVYWLLSYWHLVESSQSLKQQGLYTAYLKPISVVFSIKLSDLLFFFFLTTFERYHLFVWTVFAPKLLYEGACMMIIVFFYLFVTFVT